MANKNITQVKNAKRLRQLILKFLYSQRSQTISVVRINEIQEHVYNLGFKVAEDKIGAELNFLRGVGFLDSKMSVDQVTYPIGVFITSKGIQEVESDDSAKRRWISEILKHPLLSTIVSGLVVWIATFARHYFR